MAVSFRPIALEDLRQIRDYIAEDNVDVARRFIASLRDHCQKLDQAPLIGRARNELAEGIRSLPFGHYLIFYRVLNTGKPEIVRVLHGARDLEALFDET
ncbi:MAG: type II toxin-antitoxin system RelE/ParE family toxin [Verrucomicrobia bacterium]|nr:type II toxin-antitoxin system RelE/ParE family toxin [Verrucomicrobiota bacterium]MDA1065897.1 type II toxin-antitoxin system RelE/ParE family toxin [Verrucomicrobiota bacterium]